MTLIHTTRVQPPVGDLFFEFAAAQFEIRVGLSLALKG